MTENVEITKQLIALNVIIHIVVGAITSPDWPNNAEGAIKEIYDALKMINPNTEAES